MCICLQCIYSLICVYFNLYKWRMVSTFLLFSSNHERYLSNPSNWLWIHHIVSIFPPIDIYIVSFFAGANSTAEIVLNHASVIAWRFLYMHMIPCFVCSIWINEIEMLNSTTIMVALTVSPCSSVRFNFLIYLDVLLHDDPHFPNFFP